MNIALESRDALSDEDLENIVTVWARKPKELLFNQLVHNYQYLSLLIAFVFKKDITFEKLLKLREGKMNLTGAKCPPPPQTI